MKKEIKIIAVIFNEKMEVLLQNTKDGYILPNDTILEHERLEDAYKRFILEDIGLTIEMLGEVYAFNFDEVDTISIAFACIPLKKYEPTKPLPEDYCWFKKSATKKILIPFPYREVVVRAFFKAN